MAAEGVGYAKLERVSNAWVVLVGFIMVDDEESPDVCRLFAFYF